MKKKYYAVKKGKVPGIYETWNEAKAQVDGFSGAVYKSFSTLEEADKYIAKYDSEIIKNADLIKFKTMTIAELGISILNKLHKEKNKDAAVTIINITENSIHDFASIGNFIVERYDEEQYVDVISILQSEGKIMAITKNH